MKLHLLGSLSIGVLSMLTGIAATGCGPGLTSRAQAPNEKMLQAVDAELSNAIVGTTTLTSAPLPPMPLPESRMPVSQHAQENAPAAVQTWGAPPPPVDPELSEYGF